VCGHTVTFEDIHVIFELCPGNTLCDLQSLVICTKNLLPPKNPLLEVKEVLEFGLDIIFSLQF
jgi:hypothetical protein